MATKHVAGKNAGRIMLYALSTCPWCKKTKKLLEDLGVEYFYTDVDTLKGDEKAEAMETIKKWNPALSFPTIVLNNKKCVIGFKEDTIREALSLANRRQ